MKKMEFLLADTLVSAWWSQYPEKDALFTGWIGGPPASVFKTSSEDEILDEALNSLTSIFNLSVGSLKSQLLASYVVNWSADPFTRGAYSYVTIGSDEARKTLCSPIDNTLFFAGEGLYKGPAMGTVEAAFDSALKVVKEILSSK